MTKQSTSIGIASPVTRNGRTIILFCSYPNFQMHFFLVNMACSGLIHQTTTPPHKCDRYRRCDQIFLTSQLHHSFKFQSSGVQSKDGVKTPKLLNFKTSPLSRGVSRRDGVCLLLVIASRLRRRSNLISISSFPRKWESSL